MANSCCCSAGNHPERCCVGDPWADFNPYAEPEPLQPAVIQVAAERGVDPHLLDWHTEAVHGWEPHDVGYAKEVEAAADCLAAGGCEAE